MPGPSLEGQIPVFVTPSSLIFILPDESTHKQVLTLYNPYDFPIDYLLLSNSPNKYYIPDPSGCLKPRNRVDIVIRHSYPVLRNVGAYDKLRVQISEKGKSKILGKRDVDLKLVNELPEGSSQQEKDKFEELPQRQRHRSSAPPAQQDFGNIKGGEQPGVSPLLVAAGVFSIFVLSMPTEGTQTETWIPTMLHFTAVFKNVVCFILGLVTYHLYNTL